MGNVVYLPVQPKRESKSCINDLEILKVGDVLAHGMTDHEIEVVSLKEAPLLYRVKCIEDAGYRYFDYSSASMSLHYLK